MNDQVKGRADLNMEEEKRVMAGIAKRVEQIPPSQRAATLHCMNELRRMITVERMPAIHAIAILAAALSDAKITQDRVVIIPGGHKK